MIDPALQILIDQTRLRDTPPDVVLKGAILALERVHGLCEAEGRKGFAEVCDVILSAARKIAAALEAETKAAYARGQADQRVRDAAIARRTMIAYERKPLEMLSVYADAVAAAITSSGEELPDEPVKVAGSHGQAFRKSGENPPLAINSAISLIQGEETK